MIKYQFIFVLLLAGVACTTTSQQASHLTNSEPESDLYQNIIPELKACLEAHGGLDTWRTFGQLTYEKVSGSDPEVVERQLIDLYNRKVLITRDTTFVIGFDGQDVWQMPDQEAYPRSARFYHNLHFYFFAIPFVLGDPGVNQELMGQVNFNEKSYNKVKITFGQNVGDAPEDQYILWIDRDTNLLEFINYSVTYYDKSRAENFNARWYSDWVEVNGLKLPGTHTSYRWENDSLGEKRGVTRFRDIQLKKEQPNQDLFRKPTGAYVDELPSAEK